MQLIADIWGSFRRVPGWVQFWVAAILVPVNVASLGFLEHPYGWAVAILAVGGMLPNVAIMIYERGLSRAMSLPHLVIWTPLVIVLVIALRAEPAPAFSAYLWVVLAVDLLSLAFDYGDAWRWWRGDRSIS